MSSGQLVEHKVHDSIRTHEQHACTRMYARTHAGTQAHTHARMHTRTHTHTMCTTTNTCIHTCTQTHMPARTHTQVCMHTGAHAHTHTHACTHKHKVHGWVVELTSGRCPSCLQKVQQTGRLSVTHFWYSAKESLALGVPCWGSQYSNPTAAFPPSEDSPLSSPPCTIDCPCAPSSISTTARS